MEAKKHSYSERPCMACGGAVCNMDYMDLRKQVEDKMLGEGGVKEGMKMPLGKMAKGGEVNYEAESAHVIGHSQKKKMSHDQYMDHMGYSAKDKDGIKKALPKLIPKPKKMADGGMAKPEEQSPVDNDKFKSFQDSLNAALGGKEAKAGEPVKKAEGGEIEKEMPAGDDDDMIMDQCAHECMEAIEKKDKAAFKDALHVLVADLLKKLG